MPAFARLALVLIALACLARHPAAAAEAGHGPAVVVLDGSGSMWGTIGGERGAKFDLAREALRKSLSTLSPAVKLGLMSFGQRRRADCSDVEVLAPVEAGPPERILSIADKLNPKGKGPLSLALKEAAKQIPAGEAGSVIAIHDGLDNCWQDPCAAAAEIAKTNPATRVFLISFGLGKAETQQLQCVARETKGRVFEAQDPAALSDALSEALTLANLERVDPATGAAVPMPQAATPPKPAGAPGLRLSVALSANGDPLGAAVDWSVAKADQPDTPIKTAHAKDLALDLEPGSYVVEARFGQASARQTLTVAASGPTVAKLSLGAGVLKLNAQADRGGTALLHPVVTIYEKASPGTPAKPAWVGRNAGVQMVLPAGDYTVRVEDGLASQTADVTIKEGAGTDLAPTLGTGRLELSAVTAASGEPLADVVFIIEEDDPDSPQGRREVTRSADPAAVLTLPAGTYYIVARSGIAEVRDRIALGSGATIKHVASLNLVSIKVTTVLGAGSESAAGTPSFLIRVLSEDGARELARATEPSATFMLLPARYVVEASVSGLNIKSNGVIDLSNGRGGSVQLKLESGEVAVSGGGAAGTYWRIKDATGRTVLHSGRGGGASSRLAPGRYTLITDADEQRRETSFDLKAGERREIVAGGS